MRSLDVFINAQRVGRLSEVDSIWAFRYDEDWAQSPDSFDLSPALPRLSLEHRDGASQRPVQWYFDNLLPEERLREVIQREARIQGDDAFALLAYLGAESAGSLTLLPEGQVPQAQTGLRPLSDASLVQRIDQLPQATLTRDAAKRMSLAGAQHKLLVVYDPEDGGLFEPEGATPSTHILKPDHPDLVYAHSVINEYFTMRLARALDLAVAPAWRRYTPRPVYLVERFDRVRLDGQRTQRRHIIDACQLLNRSFMFKYHATLDDLAEIVTLCRRRALTRERLFRWLMFCLLVGNHDNHLKNLSFTVSRDGIDLAPHYDLLSTGVYHTKAFAQEQANWPYPVLAIALPGAANFRDVTRQTAVDTGLALGLKPAQIRRELDGMLEAAGPRAEALMKDIANDNAALPDTVTPVLAGEMRLLRAITRIVIPEMADRLRG